MGKEIEQKTKEGQELQRRWINKQTELMALQVGSWPADVLCNTLYVTSCLIVAIFSQGDSAIGKPNVATRRTPAN
jgi:hypothetical protein